MATDFVTGAENVRWDLSVFYSGIADPQLDADIAALTEMMKNFNTEYRGKLGERLEAAIRDYAEIEMLESKILYYLWSLHSLDMNDDGTQKKLATVENSLNDAEGTFMTFFHLELVAIDNA